MKKLILASVVVIYSALVNSATTPISRATESEGVPKPPNRMTLIEAGKFTMGCVKSIQRRCDKDELPAREVYLDAYYIDTYEVTNEEYALCVAAGACTKPYQRKGFDAPKQPVGGVTWFQASAYCSWVGKRLPTEAEWEKAARGTDARTYPWGNTRPDCGRAVMYSAGKDGCGRGTTWEVGSKPDGQSPYGVQDMAGNVWEWVNDWYSVDYYSYAPLSNPKGPERGLYRVFRGGSWETGNYYLRSCYRVKITPDYKHHHIGFRCAKSK